MMIPRIRSLGAKKGFSLIEVVLAIGIFLVTVLALVGILGSTLQSVDEAEKIGEIASVVDAVNAFLQNSPTIALVGEGGVIISSKFDVIFNAVAEDGHATVFVFKEFIGNADDIRLAVGFSPSESLASGTIGPNGVIAPSQFADAAGVIYRVVLTPSSAIPTPAQNPERYRSANRNGATGTYLLNAALTDYGEGYFAMEVRVFDEEPGNAFVENRSLAEFADVEPLFTYNTAIVR